MTFEEYKSVVNKFSFLQCKNGSIIAYLNDEIIALPTIMHCEVHNISHVSVYNTAKKTENEFGTDPNSHETVETPEELYEALLKLVEPYNKWKKSRRLALIEEL